MNRFSCDLEPISDQIFRSISFKRSQYERGLREVTLQALEFCLKRAINYISLKGSGAQNRVVSFPGSEVEGVILFLYCILC